MAETDVLQSKYEVIAGEAEATLDRLSKKSDKLAESSERAEKATSKIGSKGAGKGAPAYLSGLSAHEQEELQAARQEMLVRRARTRVARVEMQKEMLMHRVAETSLLMMVDSQNKYAKSLSKFGMTGQMVGSQLYGMGGKVGALGGVMAKLGGYAAIAGIGLEALSFVDEMTGGHLEHLAEATKETIKIVWAGGEENLHLQEQQAAYAEALKKSQEGIEQSKTSERISYGAEQFMKGTGVVAGMLFDATKPFGEATMQARQMAADAALAFAKQSGDLEHIGDVTKQFTEAMMKSAGAAENQIYRQIELSSIEKKMSEKFGKLPMAENEDALKDLIHEEKSYILGLQRSGDLRNEEAEALMKSQAEETRKRGMTQEVFDSYQKQSETSRQVEENAKSFAKQLKNVDGNTAIFDETLIALAKKYAESHPEVTGEQLTKLMERTKEIRMEKVTHSVSYPNARFSIAQSFAEGFDPDRIALAFSNDLARASERLQQSNQSPSVYGAR